LTDRDQAGILVQRGGRGLGRERAQEDALMLRRAMVMAFCLVVAVMLAGAPQRIQAESSSEKEKKEEKKQKKKKKPEDKGKSGGNATDGVNRMFDSFKKNEGGVKDDAGKVKKSVNDTYDKSK
jgi:hypothetical protein